jgi:hypothetical protein
VGSLASVRNFEKCVILARKLEAVDRGEEIILKAILKLV